MNLEAYQKILNRVSTKRFKPDSVPEDLIQKVVDAGLAAPSGVNYQGTLFLVLKGRKRDELAKLNAKIMERDIDPFYGAPVVIAVLDKKDSYCPLYDGSIAAAQMLLAAEALGLGACWIHRARQEFESEEGKALLKEARIEDEVIGVSNIIIGYPDGPRPSKKERKPNRVFHLE